MGAVKHNKALHRTGIPLRSIAAGELVDSAEPLARSCAIGAGVELRSTDLTSRRATRSGYQAVGAELVLISLTPYQVTRIRTNRLNARAVILKGRKGSNSAVRNGIP